MDVARFNAICNEAERMWRAMHPRRNAATHTAAMQIGRMLCAAERALVAAGTISPRA